MASLTESIHYFDLPIAGAEAMAACTTRAFPRHTHDQFGIGVVDSGGHSSWSGRGQVEAGPGNLICVNPGEVHDGRAIGERPRSWRIVYFDTAAMQDLRTDILDGAQTELTFSSPVFSDESVRRHLDAVFAGSGDAMLCETAILRLVARLTIHSTAPRALQTRTTARIQRARECIDADPAAPLTLRDLAKETGLSRYQLLRGFAQELGLTPHAYILQRRIELARRLIRAGHSLAEIALRAGFFDQSHLTRCFARQYGVSPSRYAARRC